MLKIRLRYALVLGAAAVLYCTRITGTSDETLIKSARVYNPDFTSASNVNVKVYAVNDTSRIPEYQTMTDDTGGYRVEVSNGIYNILIGDDELGAFQDSVVIKTSFTTLRDDTLDRTGVLRGKVVLEPVHNPRTATVQVVGTDKYSNVAPDGTFIISGLPEGEYMLRSVSTVAEYTPTYADFSINPTAEDTTEMTVQLIYTGIPMVKNLRLSYDTLLRNVTLTWDTVSYFLLQDFMIYRDDGSALVPSMEPIASTKSCSYTENPGYDNSGSVNYRVAVRTKTLIVGPTFSNVSVFLQEPVFWYLPRTETCYLGFPCSLHVVVTGTRGLPVRYAWNIGSAGAFIDGSGPDTAITLYDTMSSSYWYRVKITVDNRITIIDSMSMSINIAWAKMAPPFVSDGNISYIHPEVLNGRLFAFCIEDDKEQLWWSVDAVIWTELTDSLEIPFNHSKPVIFDNRFCIVDDTGYLWTSTDAKTWDRSTMPVCKTRILSSGATLPSGNVPPEMYTEGNRLCLQPFPGTGQDSLLITEELENWHSIPFNVGRMVTDFAVVNGATYFCGYDWYALKMWVVRKDGEGMQSIPAPAVLDNAGKYECYLESCLKAPVLGGAKTAYYHDWTVSYTMSTLPVYDSHAVPPRWYYVQLPMNLTYYSLVTFNDDLYLVSNEGVYKAWK